MRHLAAILLSVFAGIVANLGDAAAQAFGPRQSGRVPEGTRERVQSGEMRPLGDILDSVRRQRPGNLADVQGPHMTPSGDPHYRLKWVSPNGRVEWLDTDARTGRIIGESNPDQRTAPFSGRPNRFPKGGGALGIAPGGR
jgi:hypothetical protein